ncbi:MAG: phosphotransferase [Anaerolineae bacterium]|nr:phosphotransferase [Anaerolineae bacterium]
MTSTILQHYLDTWALTDPHLLAETPTSHVYTAARDGETVVLKLLTSLGAEDEASGAVALRCYDGHGAVRLLRHDDGAHLLEYAAGDDLVPLVRRGDDGQAAAIIADVLNRLHSAGKDAPPDGLVPLRTWSRALFAKAEQEAHLGEDSIFVRAAPLADALLANPRDVCALHGDIHHENVRHSPRGWLAIDPKGLYGERTYDTANTLCNPLGMPDLVENEARFRATAGLLADKLNIDLPRVFAFAFFYTCLSACWSLEGGQHEAARHTLRIAEIEEAAL